MVDGRRAAWHRREMEERMPTDWKISVTFVKHDPHHELTDYQIVTAAGETVRFGPWGEPFTVPDGWTITYRDSKFMGAVHVTAPDGRSVVLDDSLLA